MSATRVEDKCARTRLNWAMNIGTNTGATLNKAKEANLARCLMVPIVVVLGHG